METFSFVVNKSGSLTVKGRELPKLDVGLPDSSDPIRDFEVTYTELVRLVKASRSRTIYFHFRWFSPSIDQSGVPEGKGRLGWDASSTVTVSRREAVRCLDNAYNKVFRDKVLCRISFAHNCMFIGGC